MCGIAGGVWTDPDKQISEDVLRRMTEQIRHRGPDDAGHLRQESAVHAGTDAASGVALGFRRLSIIDLSTGHQPMSNEDGSVWVVFNGEIYNFPALRKRLEGAGHQFRTHSDTETIVHLYEDEGVECFGHLNGMFAIAIWDSRKRRLVLARDRLGEKPLVYFSEPGRLSFASELKSLLELPGVARDVDPNAIDAYLTYQYVPHPQTIFRGIRKLPPGHCAIWESGRLEVRRYWSPDFNLESRIPREKAVITLRELLRDAVKIRMQSDVPLGAFLSGGIDSSLVVALMQQQATQPVKTFSIGFSEKSYDETPFARLVAKHLGTEHQEFQVTPNGVEILPKLVWHYDEPFADSSAVPTWYLAQLTRQKVTVALTGDGGDELFMGYPRYRATAWASRIDRLPPLRTLLAARVWQSLPGAGRQKSLARKFRRFSEALALEPQRRYLEWIAIFNESRRAELYSESFVRQLSDSDPARFISRAWAEVAKRDPMTAVSLTDLVTYLPCDLMTKVDMASMAHSLECRQPFLDHRLVEFAAGLPTRYKYRNGRGKQLLRQTFADLLPPEIWERKKMGFGVPLDRWFRAELKPMAHDLLLDQTARQRGLFRPEVIERLLSEHASTQFDHSYRLWALVILELWLRQWCR
ncbi:MAG: Asparagine synthetase 1 [Planctomycetota bacterium]